MLFKVIFFTLIHSLWIGLVVAIICGIILLSSRKSTPHFRYNLLSACLTLFTLGIISAAWYEYSLVAASVESQGLSFYWRNVDNLIPALFSPEKNSIYENIIQILSDWKMSLLEFSYPLLWIWSIVMSYKVLQLFRSMQHINKLKKTGLLALDEQLLLKSESLREQFKISAAVKLFYSSMAAVPQVIGWLKPVVLIPIGLINHLSPEQVEAVIAHELAHIKRRDYIINCLQYVLEIFFFFNPFLLWISYKIKEEREHCCDDLVMVTHYRKKDYIKALIVCSEYSAYTPVQALTLIKGKNQLLKRVTRLLTNQNLTFNNMEKFVLICLSLFMISFASLYGTKIKDLPVIEYLNDKINEFQSDTVKPKVEHKVRIEKSTITTDKDGVRKEEKTMIDTSYTTDVEGMGNGPIIIDGGKFIFPPSEPFMMPFRNNTFTWKDFPDNEFFEKGLSDEEREQINDELKDVTIYLRENGKIIERHIKDATVHFNEWNKENKKHQKELFRYHKDGNEHRININEEEIKRMAEEAGRYFSENAEELKRELGKLDQLRELEINIRVPGQHPENHNYNYNNSDNEERHIKLKREKEMKQKDKEMLKKDFKMNFGPDRMFMERPSKMNDPKMEQIQNLLIFDKIITAGSLRSISLDNKQFIVNGVIQSKKVHKKYKKMFLKGDGDRLKLNYM